MKVRFVWPGKTQNAAIRSLEEFYVGRTNNLVKCEVVVTKAVKGIGEKEAALIKRREAEEIEKHLRPDSEFLVCLSQDGKRMSSGDFSNFLGDISQGVSKGVTFVVGGFLGLDRGLVEKADMVLSLSRMTFSHELSRIMLLEQIYRAMSILKGLKYAK